jgi:hypothetical protein
MPPFAHMPIAGAQVWIGENHNQPAQNYTHMDNNTCQFYPEAIALEEVVFCILVILGGDPAVLAAGRYIARRERWEHPQGEFDAGGRWYPSPSEGLDTRCYRTPSRRWPYSYMLACRTVKHCAYLEHADDLTLVRRIVRIAVSAKTVENAIDAIHSELSAARRARREQVAAA